MVFVSCVQIKAYRAYAMDIEHQSMSNTSQVHIADSMLGCCKSDLDEVLQIMVAHDKNPYTYGESSSITMPVQTVSFFEPDRSAISVSQLAENSSVQLYMLNPASAAVIQSGRLVESADYDPLRLISYKTVTIEPGKSKLWTMPDVNTNAQEGIGVHIQVGISMSISSEQSPQVVVSRSNLCTLFTHYFLFTYHGEPLSSMFVSVKVKNVFRPKPLSLNSINSK